MSLSIDIWVSGEPIGQPRARAFGMRPRRAASPIADPLYRTIASALNRAARPGGEGIKQIAVQLVRQIRFAIAQDGHQTRMYDPGTAKPWKDSIKLALKRYRPREPSQAAFYIELHCFFPRPKSHYGSGRNADQVKPSAPRDHTRTPDCDNLIKALKDSITDLGLWRDDSQVIEERVTKDWTDPGGAGARIIIEELI